METRTFAVSAYMPPNNTRYESRTIKASTPHAAAKMFAEGFGCELYSVRWEQPEEWEGILFSVWSAGWSGSGQRIWIKEAH